MLEGICTVGVIIMVPGIKVGTKAKEDRTGCRECKSVWGRGLLEGHSQPWWGRHQRQKLGRVLER